MVSEREARMAPTWREGVVRLASNPAGQGSILRDPKFIMLS